MLTSYSLMMNDNIYKDNAVPVTTAHLQSSKHLLNYTTHKHIYPSYSSTLHS